jgi:hypothetical protein
MPEPSILDARLAEIDRRLRTIQSELAPAPESAAPPTPFPGPTLVPSADPPDAASELMAQLRQLVAAQERWLASAREVLAADDRSAVAVSRPAPAAVPPASGPRAAASWAEPVVGVSAGPFAGTEALRRFELAVSSLPEVREVVLREYTGDDRVVVDVHLFEPIS